MNSMDYRDLIKAEFLKRRNADSFYSLRNFAKDLELKPSHLSYILRKEKGLSKDNAVRIARVLGLKTFEVQRFCFLVSAQSGRGYIERNLAKQGLNRKWIKEAEHKLLKRLY
jgi:plasmid maintenance system antidote protein VapI